MSGEPITEKPPDAPSFAYTSSIVALPPTVRELIGAYEEMYKRHNELRQQLEKHAAREVATSAKEKKGEETVIRGKVLQSGVSPKERSITPTGEQKTVVAAAVVDTSPSAQVVKSASQTIIADLKAELESTKQLLDKAREAGSANPPPSALTEEQLLYEKSQLEEKIKKMQKELAFVNEKNTALEGQLQRLFTSGMNEAPPANQKETPPPSEELEALQKEVEALKAQNEKYRGHYKKENQKRIKLEEVNKTLNQENAELKDTLKGYQREVNEKELNLAREASEIEEVERCKLLERECVKLRNALRERREEAEARHCADEEQIQRHSKTIKVYEVAVKKLQKELLAYQVKAFATPRAGPPVQESKPSGKPSSTVSPEPEPDVAPEVTADEMTAPTESPAPPLLSAERGKMLEELKTTYEKRLESLEAHKKAEMKQLLVHNRELKQALASCQEELQEKKRVLNQLQRERAASRQSFLAESMSTPGKFGFSGRSSPEPTPLSVGADLLSPSQSIMLNEIESRYDPENMSVTEAVQLENEALLQRLSIMQEEKWSMSGHIEDLQHRCANQQEELKIQSNMLNHIISVKNTILPPGQEGSPQSNLKFLQTLLQETLEKNLTLEKENDNLKLKVARHE